MARVRGRRALFVKLSRMTEDSVLWSLTCDACDHEWMQTTPEDSDPKAEEVECPECGSELLHAEYAGRS